MCSTQTQRDFVCQYDNFQGEKMLNQCKSCSAPNPVFWDVSNISHKKPALSLGKNSVKCSDDLGLFRAGGKGCAIKEKQDLANNTTQAEKLLLPGKRLRMHNGRSLHLNMYYIFIFVFSLEWNSCCGFGRATKQEKLKIVQCNIYSALGNLIWSDKE